MKKLTFAILALGISISLFASIENIETSHRYNTAKKVFDDLVQAKGVKNMPTPNFVLTKTTRNVAWSNYKELEVGIEEKAYDICASFGKDSLNALAAILGHELTHYYEKHGWVEKFVGDYTSIENDHQLLANEEHLIKELQADYLGGFLAYAAGYHSLEIMPQFLEQVYRTYGLNNQLKGYPSLSERIKTAKESEVKCRQLIDVFECANYLLCVGDHDSAKDYYSFILKEFQSREIYNNLGVCALSAYLDLSSSQDIKYAYPFELDAHSRLQKNTRGGSSDFSTLEQQKTALFSEAIEYFKTAMLLDDTYAVSFLNLACSYTLSGEIEDANYFLNKSIKIAKKHHANKTLGDSYILEGILNHKMGDSEEAKKSFALAINYSPNLSELNQQIIAGETVLDLKKVAIDLGAKSQEKIGAFSLDKCLVDLKRGRLETDYILEINNEIQFAILQRDDSKVFVHIDQEKDAILLIQQLIEGHHETSHKGIVINSSQDQVLSKYSEASRSISFNNGSRLIYPSSGIIFELDLMNKVRQWAIYRTE